MFTMTMKNTVQHIIFKNIYFRVKLFHIGRIFADGEVFFYLKFLWKNINFIYLD